MAPKPVRSPTYTATATIPIMARARDMTTIPRREGLIPALASPAPYRASVEPSMGKLAPSGSSQGPTTIRITPASHRTNPRFIPSLLDPVDTV